MVSAAIVAASSLIVSSGSSAGEPAKPGAALATVAVKRYPQPVRVGDLVHRDVIEPQESRVLLGRVVEVVRLAGGREAIVMKYGGAFGFGGRDIAVPTDAMVLLGDELEVVDLTPAQLERLPTFRLTDHDAAILRADDVILMGLARPSH